MNALSMEKRPMLHPALETKRALARQFWESKGVPGSKVEEWKYTSLKSLTTAKWTQIPVQPDIAHIKHLPQPLLGADSEIRFVFVNGWWVPQLSELQLPHGVHVASLRQMLEQDTAILDRYLDSASQGRSQPFMALNTAQLQDGVVIRVDKNTKIDPVIELVFHAQEMPGGIQCSVAQPRILVIAEEGSEATLVERHSGFGPSVSNVASEIFVADNARLHHYRLQDLPQEASSIATQNVVVHRDSYYDSFTLTLGAGLSRHEVHGQIKGTNSNLRVNGAYLLANAQHADTTILIDHMAEHGTSNQTFKGIVDGQARAVFQGKIYVHKGAQKTNGYQLNNAMLLSDRAEVDCKPELEIYADDVRCSHGATTGKIDEAPLFYLRARGIPLQQARLLLMQAFLSEAMEEISAELLRQILLLQAMKWLKSHVS